MGLKSNFFYNSIITSANYLFPLIVFPYVSRILGPHYLGIFNFVDSVIYYFYMFGMMGIGIIGVREIAAVQHDMKKRNEVFSSLLFLNAIFVATVIVLLIICIQIIPTLNQYKFLFVVGIANIIASFLLLDWLFKGMEDFRFITIRTIIIKCLYLASIFIFVRVPEDYGIYYILTTLSVIANAAVNLWYSRHFVKFDFHSFSKGVMLYLKPNVHLGAYWILTSIYASFYTIYLGFISTPNQIGYFTTASKLIILILSVYTAWTTVVMPRASFMLAEGNSKEHFQLIQKSISSLFSLGIPIVIIGITFTPDIIHTLAGDRYEGAYIPSMILIPLIIIIGYEQIIILQTLTPMKKDNVLLRNSFWGAITGVACGVVLVPRYHAVGASVSWIISELCVLTLSQWYLKKHYAFHFPVRLFLLIIYYHTPAFIICIATRMLFPYISIYRIIIASIIVFIFSLFVQLKFIKEPVITSFVYNTFARFNNIWKKISNQK